MRALTVFLAAAFCLSACGAGDGPSDSSSASGSDADSGSNANSGFNADSRRDAARNAADPDPQHTSWRDYGGGPDQSKYVVTDAITKANVGQLERAWFYSTEDNQTYQFSPIIVGNMMYLEGKNSSLIALDAATGEEIWIHANLRGITRRGLNYWESTDGEDKRILIFINNYIQAIDAVTGQSILSFGDNGLADLKQGLAPRDPDTVSRIQSGTPGKVFENLLIVGSSPGEGYLSAPGHVRAFDVVTGELVWTFHTIPQPGEFGYDTWPEDAYRYVGGANVWGEMSVDKDRGIVYLPTGSPTYDYWGGDRIGQNLFGNSLIALDARTGERLWHYQVVHHDVWDYDISAAPQLVTVDHDGERIDAVAIATKHGFVFAFDRVTGEPLWPIEERPVPQSTLPGEVTWPTQPYPTVIPPFHRQETTSADLNPYFLTDEERAEWTERLDALEALGRTTLFAPPSDEYDLLATPGAVGGANWGNTAADPGNGRVYVYARIWPSLYAPLELRTAEPPDAADGELAAGGFGRGGLGRGGRGGGAAANRIETGRAVYAEQCVACHGEDRVGIGTAPSLLGMETRVGFADFQQLMSTGRGKMPAFAPMPQEDLESVFAFLGGDPDEDSVVPVPEGPVVASSGAPGGLLNRPVSGGGGFGFGGFGPSYPEGADAPDIRYFSQGYGLEYAAVFRPPWSTLTAYDLNEGTILWQRPIGTDLMAALEGAENTGVPEAQRNGMIVTSTGVLFSTAKDGKVYAFDADTGDELWSAELPRATEGLPAMYELNGRAYLVVTATSSLDWGTGDRNDELAALRPETQGGYVVFALPDTVGR